MPNPATSPDRKQPKKLTQFYIDSLPAAPKGKRIAYADFGDGMVSGLKIRVTDRGSKSFILWRRYNGSKNPTARSLGEVGTISLSDAREKARQWIGMIKRGEDPAVVEAKVREANTANSKITFGVVFEDYLKRKIKGLRKAADIEREMRNDLLPHWKTRPLSEISRRDIVRVIEEVMDRGTYQAHNVYGHARTFFNWVIAHDIVDGLEISPCHYIKPGELIGPKKHRDRVLNDLEIAEFWKAANRLGYPFGTLFKMLLLTGQRRGEVAEARWCEFDLKKRIWTIPEERFKSDSKQIVPLTDDMMRLLETIPRWNAGDFLFSSTNGTTAVSGFDYQKRKLFDIMTGALGSIELKNFVLHDLRRTVRSNLSALKVEEQVNGEKRKRRLVPDEVCEMIIGHGRKGMQRIYDQHEYIEEMREALAAWNAQLARIVS
jgi:integrase